MSVLKFLFGENTPLLSVDKFSQDYNLRVKNEFIMGKENLPISLTTLSDITIDQEKKENAILNSIYLKSITGNTDNEAMKPFLEQSLALSEISPAIHIKRNLQGKIISIEQKEKLTADWELWKEKRLKSVFTEEKEQIRFISNYTNGLKNFDQNFKRNLQYILLLPEIYSVIFPPNKHFTFLYSHSQLNSRLVEGMEYQYQMKLVKLDEENDILSLELHATLNNKEELNRRFLNKIYAAHPEFSLTNFGFTIEIKYVFQKSTSKIISAKLDFSEKLHDHLSYSICMNMHELNE